MSTHAGITLGEGNTPLVRSRSIGPSMGIENLYFKLETTNPTGSYKDRFAASAISHLLDQKATLCLGTSSGNTGAALAAYSAAAGLPCILAIVDTAPEGKLRQMAAYGATLVKVSGFGTDAQITKEIASELTHLAISLNTSVQISAYCLAPLGMAGVESISQELADSGISFDHVFSPSGGGGLTLAVARGFQKTEQPETAIHCVQPEGNDTIAGALRAGDDRAKNCECTTIVSGLQVATVLDGHNTLSACRESGGTGHLVSDEEVFECQTRLAREEGIFSEPAGAVALAGAIRAVKNGELDPKSTIACLVTGSGFKDEASVSRMIGKDYQCPQVDSFSEFEEIVRNSTI